MHNMTELSKYHHSIVSLALQLERLLKVINHSDPSAETMKHVLYDKYKTQLAQVAETIKPAISWVVFSRYLGELHTDRSLSISAEARAIVITKLIKDFEDQFVIRHRLSEFTEVPVDENQKERLKRIRKQIRNNRKIQATNVRADDIGDMIQLKFQQKTAKKSLEKLVKAFSKIEMPETEN